MPADRAANGPDERVGELAQLLNCLADHGATRDGDKQGGGKPDEQAHCDVDRVVDAEPSLRRRSRRRRLRGSSGMSSEDEAAMVCHGY